MASIIKIKRSEVSGNPAVLGAGELAYSGLAHNGSNGGDRLYIGMGTETSGNAVNHVVIGGKYFTDLLDHSPGTLTATSAIVVDADKKIDDLLIDNLQLNGNTLSTTDINGNLLITPNGTGKTVIKNLHIGDADTSIAEFIYDTVGGAIAEGTGITIINADTGNTSTVSITNTGVTAGSYGSSTAIPTFTVNAQGQLTAASTTSITVGDGALNLTMGTAGATNTSVTIGTGTGFTANDTATTTTYDIKVGPALSNLATFMTTASAGFIKRSGQDSYVIDTNTYLTSSTGVTTFSAGTTGLLPNTATSGAITLSGTLAVANGGTGTTNGSITGTGALTFTAGSTNNNVNLVPVGTGTVDVASKRITSVASPTGDTDAANKAYVDAVKTGLNVKDAARLATTANLTATYDNTGQLISATGTVGTITGTGPWTATVTGVTSTAGLSVGSTVVATAGTGTLYGGSPTSVVVTAIVANTSFTYTVTGGTTPTAGTVTNIKTAYTTAGVGSSLINSGVQAALTLDSVPAVVGDRILVKDQTAALQNGIYTVVSIGSASTNWILVRATDIDNNPAGELGGGDFVFVQEGTTQADNGYVVTTNGAITIGTTAVNWVQFSGAGQITAGDGLTKSGNTINAVGTADRISVTSDAIDIAGTYVGQNTITTLGTIGTGVWQGTLIGPTYGGTGVNNGTKTITLGGNFTHTGAHTLGLTTTASTSVTLPTTGTLATLAGTEALSNKTITSSSFSGTTIAGSGLITFTNATNATALNTAAVVLSGGLSVAKAIYVGTNITGAGAETSTLDGFQIDGGGY